MKGKTQAHIYQDFVSKFFVNFLSQLVLQTLVKSSWQKSYQSLDLRKYKHCYFLL